MLRATTIAIGPLTLARSVQFMAQERTVVDELGQAWLRYDAADGTLYLIRPDGYVMGRWRDASAANINHALRRVLGDRR